MSTWVFLCLFVVANSAIWVFFDASRLRDERHTGVGPLGVPPQTWAAAVFLLWPVAFPYYLNKRPLTDGLEVRSGPPPRFVTEGLTPFALVAGLVGFGIFAGLLVLGELQLSIVGLVVAAVGIFGGRRTQMTREVEKVELGSIAWEQVGFSGGHADDGDSDDESPPPDLDRYFSSLGAPRGPDVSAPSPAPRPVQDGPPPGVPYAPGLPPGPQQAPPRPVAPGTASSGTVASQPTAPRPAVPQPTAPQPTALRQPAPRQPAGPGAQGDPPPVRPGVPYSPPPPGQPYDPPPLPRETAADPPPSPGISVDAAPNPELRKTAPEPPAHRQPVAPEHPPAPQHPPAPRQPATSAPVPRPPAPAVSPPVTAQPAPRQPAPAPPTADSPAPGSARPLVPPDPKPASPDPKRPSRAPKRAAGRVAGSYAYAAKAKPRVPVGAVVAAALLLIVLAAAGWFWRSALFGPTEDAADVSAPTAEQVESVEALPEQPPRREGGVAPPGAEAAPPAEAPAGPVDPEVMRAWTEAYLQWMGPLALSLDEIDFEGIDQARCRNLQQALRGAQDELGTSPDPDVRSFLEPALVVLNDSATACRGEDQETWATSLLEAKRLIHQAQVMMDERYRFAGISELELESAIGVKRSTESISGRFLESRGGSDSPSGLGDDAFPAEDTFDDGLGDDGFGEDDFGGDGFEEDGFGDEDFGEEDGFEEDPLDADGP